VILASPFTAATPNPQQRLDHVRHDHDPLDTDQVLDVHVASIPAAAGQHHQVNTYS
jgi:hypothetical protein